MMQYVTREEFERFRTAVDERAKAIENEAARRYLELKLAIEVSRTEIRTALRVIAIVWSVLIVACGYWIGRPR